MWDMKKIDLGQTINTLANAGVIAGIAFLAVEIHQNNQLLQADAIGVVLETRMVRNEAVAENEGLAALVTKNRRKEVLTDVERTRISAFLARSNMGWQRDYFLYQQGILPENLLRANIPVMRNAFEPGVDTFGHFEHWQAEWRESATSEFQEFVEQCVLSKCESIPD